MRVALVAPFVSLITDSGAQMGGAQVILAELARGLSARGHDVTLLAARGSHVAGVTVIDLGIEADPSASIGPRRYAAAPSQEKAFAAVRAWLDMHAREFDVIHSHAFDAPAFAHLSGLGALHTLHLPPIDDAVVAAARASDAVLATVSQSCGGDWRAAGVRVDAILQDGADIDAIPEGDGGGGYLALAGRMSPEKGVDTACRVADKLTLPLQVAGPIYDQSYFDDRVRPLIGAGVDYLGALDQGSIWRLLGGARVSLLPVRWNEPFGLVALESLACGTPVAAYDRGALREIVTDGVTGRLAAPDDEGAFLEAVRAALALSRTPCRASARRYDLSAMLDAHEALYRRLNES
jgi:glycosyltransferase involved in cell wall biosynthesis